MAKKKKGQRADGLIEVTHTMPDGRRRHFYGGTRAEAETKYQETLQQMALSAQQEAAGPFFETVAGEWWEQAQSTLKAGSLRSYKAAYRAAVAEFGRRRMQEIKPRDVAAYLKDLKAQGKAQTTMGNYHTVVTGIFEYWCADLDGESNPSRLVRNLKGPRVYREPPADGIVEQIRAHSEGKMGLLALLAMYTGLRLGEMMALTWGDVDLPGRLLTVTKSVTWVGNRPQINAPKTRNAVRQVPILEPLAARLEQEGRRPAGEYLTSGTQEPLTASQYTKRWLAYCRALGLAHQEAPYKPYKGKRQAHWKPDVTAHQLRHYCATLLDEAKVPMKARQLWMGHSDIHTTMQIYTHRFTGEMEAAKAEMDKVVKTS